MDTLDKLDLYLNEADKNFEKAFNIWLKGAQKIINDYAKKVGKGDKRTIDIYTKILTVKKGRKYWKVMDTPKDGVGGSVWAFINTLNGDILKPASFKAPAKHARGNLYDDKKGLGSIGPYGPAYMRGI